MRNYISTQLGKVAWKRTLGIAAGIILLGGGMEPANGKRDFAYNIGATLGLTGHAGLVALLALKYKKEDDTQTND